MADSSQRRGAPAKPVSLKQVARLAGVGSTTVHRVIHHDGTSKDLSPATSEKVWRAIRQLGYPAEPRSRPTWPQVALVHRIKDLTFPNHYYSAIIDACENSCFQRGHELVLVRLGTAGDWLSRQLNQRVCGAIIHEQLADEYDELRKHLHVPHVLLNWPESVARSADSVVPDDAQGIRVAISHLHALGHRRIMYLDAINAPHGRSSRLRAEAARTIAGQLAIDLIPVSVQVGPGDMPLTAESGNTGLTPVVSGYEQNADSLVARFRHHDLPTGLIVYNSQEIPFLYDLLHRAGREIPRDLSIIAIGDNWGLEVCRPQVTAIAISANLLAQACCDLLLRRIADPTASFQEVTIPETLVARASTAAPPGR